jgi:hypothetical protein
MTTIDFTLFCFVSSVDYYTSIQCYQQKSIEQERERESTSFFACSLSYILDETVKRERETEREEERTGICTRKKKRTIDGKKVYM